MTQETRFSRIAVTADDDDDFVIEAGASQLFAQVPAGPAIELDPVSAADPAPAAMLEPVVDQLADPVSGLVSATSVAPALEEEPRSQPKPAPPSARNSSDAYETTLEDLDSVSMSGAQKAVIAIAVLAVVAFVASQFLA